MSVHLCNQLHFHLNFINLLPASQGDSIRTLTWISPRLTDAASPLGIHVQKGVPDFSSLPVSFAPALLLGFLPKLCPCHSPVCETSGFPFVWQTGASNVWWSNLPQMCKTWLIGEMSSRVVENTGAPGMEKRGPFPFITSTDRWSQFSFSIFLYYVPQLINALHPLQVDLFSTWSRCLPPLEKTTGTFESVGPIIKWAIREAAALHVNNEYMPFSLHLTLRPIIKYTYMWNKHVSAEFHCDREWIFCSVFSHVVGDANTVVLIKWNAQ